MHVLIRPVVFPLIVGTLLIAYKALSHNHKQDKEYQPVWALGIANTIFAFLCVFVRAIPVSVNSDIFPTVVNVAVQVVPTLCGCVANIIALFILTKMYAEIKAECSKMYVEIKAGIAKQNRKKVKNGRRGLCPSDIMMYGDPTTELDGNIIVSKHIRIGVDERKTGINSNMLVIDATGSGKTTNVAYPNILQMYGSYVISDSSGMLYKKTAHVLRNRGYEIRVLNMREPEKSDHYNPFCYLNTEADVSELVSCLMQYLNRNNGFVDQFWNAAARLLLNAIILLLRNYEPEEKQNFATLYDILENVYAAPPLKALEKIAEIFEKVAAEDPDSACVNAYQKFAQVMTANTAYDIVCEIRENLEDFGARKFVELTSTDNMGLNKLGDRKTALFITESSEKETSQFVSASLYNRTMAALFDCAAKSGHTRLEHHVTFILDDFPNEYPIPNFTKYMSCSKKYGISYILLCRSISLLSEIYHDDTSVIICNCDAIVVMGGKIKNTDDKTTGFIKERIKFMTLNKSAADQLISGPNQCIVAIRGSDLFCDEQYSPKDYPKFV